MAENWILMDTGEWDFRGRGCGKTQYKVEGFENLSLKAQLKILESGVGFYPCDVLNSEHKEVRLKALEQKWMNYEILDNMVFSEADTDILLKIFEHPKFVKTKKNLKKLSVSFDIRIREKVAECKETDSTILSDMLQRGDDANIIYKIMKNPNFERNKENLKILVKSNFKQIRTEVASWEIPLDMLENMLKEEQLESVVEVIISNPVFKKAHSKRMDKNMDVQLLFDVLLDLETHKEFIGPVMWNMITKLESQEEDSI